MPDRRAGTGKDEGEPKSQHSDEAPLKWAGDVVVTPAEEPAELSDDKRIHPRRPMPLVPEGSTKDKKEDE